MKPIKNIKKYIFLIACLFVLTSCNNRPSTPEKHTHQLEHIEKVEATCTTAGTKEYWVCKECNLSFLDASGNIEMTESFIDEITIPSTGHQIVIDKKEEATCTKTGLTEGCHCKACKEILIAQTDIPLLEHTWIEATCTTPKTCTMCGTTEGTILSHIESEWIVDQDATCTQVGKQHQECTRCKEIVREQILPKKEHTWMEATCTTPKSCATCEITEGSPLGHMYADTNIQWEWEVDFSKAVAILTCQNDINHQKKIDASISTKETTEGTVFEASIIFNDKSYSNSQLWGFSRGLEYELNKEGTYYSVIGIGTCLETNIRIPPTYKNLPVKIIGKKAFSSDKSFTSVTIPEGVTSIEEGAFFFCKNLAEIVVPSSVKNIGGNAFYGCSSLTNIIIPEGVTEIQTSTFRGCGKLINITLPTTLIHIGDDAFNNCLSLKSILIPEGVTSIGRSAFYMCRELTNIMLPDTIQTIGVSAFPLVDNLQLNEYDNCYYLGNKNNPYVVLIKAIDKKNITQTRVHHKTKLIYHDAFSGCDKLTSISIENSVVSIGEDAFRNCEYLTSITIPNSVVSIKRGAFYKCTDLTQITLSNSITRIEQNTFVSCWNLNSIVIPSGVEKIGNGAFKDCTSLTSITLPNSIICVEENAFEGCIGLVSITLSDNIVNIGPSAFKNCSALQYNEYENGYYLGNEDNPYLTLISIKDLTLSSVIIHEKTQVISNYACKDWASLTNITLPNNITHIGEYAFIDCTSLTSITLPNGLIGIGRSAFYNCTSLTNITLPDSVTSIGNSAFFNCTSLTSITLPNSITSIGDSAFSMCSSLTSITIPNSVTSIGDSAFSNCNSLTSITIPSSLTSIEDSTFSGCSSLTSITIPSNITKIGNSAFSYCTGLTSIFIPSSITFIGPGVFSYCDNLTSITFEITNGWFVTNQKDATTGTRVNVTNAIVNIENFTSTYKMYYWKRYSH